MRLPPCTLLLILLAATLCHAQQQAPWQGEWGDFNDPSAANGERLTISKCTAQSCAFQVSAKISNSHCGTAEDATFTLTTPTDATAALRGEDAAHSCKLQLHRSSTGTPSIALTATGDTCTSYYCTSGGASFNHTYPLSSTHLYTGPHTDECLAHPAPARAATCNNPALAALEQQWNDLYDDYPLGGPAPEDESAYTYADKIDATIITTCNTNPNPAQCLQARYTADIAAMTAQKTAFISGYTERGDPATAAQVATKIAGRYRHNFANGDVQGDHFRSTDTLTLTPISRNSIHFDVELNFYNGHTCSLSGGALYRKDGSFVFDDNPTNAIPNDPVCHLAIVPTTKGVELKDLTGTGCKNISCGERGGYNGAGFTFKERVPTHAATK
jgi:hypothetical protein